jgi:hypothetical protein
MRNLTPHPLVIFPPTLPLESGWKETASSIRRPGKEIRPLLIIPPDPAGLLRMEEINEQGDPVRIGDQDNFAIQGRLGPGRPKSRNPCYTGSATDPDGR